MEEETLPPWWHHCHQNKWIEISLGKLFDSFLKKTTSPQQVIFERCPSFLQSLSWNCVGLSFTCRSVDIGVLSFTKQYPNPLNPVMTLACTHLCWENHARNTVGMYVYIPCTWTYMYYVCSIMQDISNNQQESLRCLETTYFSGQSTSERSHSWRPK